MVPSSYQPPSPTAVRQRTRSALYFSARGAPCGDEPDQRSLRSFPVNPRMACRRNQKGVSPVRRSGRAALGLLALALALAVAGSACSKPEAPFAGVWKARCSDYWGVQIQRAALGRYAVTFCGRSGCIPRGEWMADTRITDDPMFQVISATKLGIRNKDGAYYTYVRCSTDTNWAIGAGGE